MYGETTWQDHNTPIDHASLGLGYNGAPHPVAPITPIGGGGGGETKEGAPVSPNSKEVTVTGERLPRYTQHSEFSSGESGMPATAGGRNAAGVTRSHISQEAYAARGPYAGNAITQDAKGTSDAAFAQRKYGTPDTVTTTTKDLVGGQSLTQAGPVGSNYSASELAAQGDFHAQAIAATPQPSMNNIVPQPLPKR